MTNFVPVTPESHAKKVWKRVTDYKFAAADTIMPLVGAELSQAVALLPIGFVKHETAFQLVAIASLKPRQNLCVAPNGNWLGTYIPSVIRAYPFRLLKSGNSDETILCIDEDSELLSDDLEKGSSFFDDNNQPSEELKNILKFLSAIESNRIATQSAVNAIDEAGLIKPWTINLKQDDKILPVEGLFHVDEEALNELDGEAFLELRKAGGLNIAYAQLFSMNQLQVLERLGKLQGQILEQQTANSDASNMSGFSLADDNGSLVFD